MGLAGGGWESIRLWARGRGGAVCVLTLTLPVDRVVVVAGMAQADVARHRVEAPAVLAEPRPEHHTLVRICGRAEPR